MYTCMHIVPLLCEFTTFSEILDYQGISDILKFSSSVSEQCVSVDIIENSVLEDTESLTVALSLLTGGDSNIQLKPSSAKIFIADNDGEGSIHTCRYGVPLLYIHAEFHFKY